MKEIESAKTRIEIGEIDLVRVSDDMLMLKRQVDVRHNIQPHQGMHTSGISMLTSNMSVSQLDAAIEDIDHTKLPAFGRNRKAPSSKSH